MTNHSSAKTFEAFARIMSESFETAKRDSGEEFTRCKEDAPEWVKDAVKDAHMALPGRPLPNDWVYSECASIASDIYNSADDDSDADSLRDSVQPEADVYNSDRKRWYADNGFADECVDEARENWGTEPDESILSMIGQGQAFARAAIRDALISAIESEVDDATDREDEE